MSDGSRSPLIRGEIADVVTAAGLEAVMTRDDHQSGSDRVFEAATNIDPDAKAGIILNVQGDIPAIEPETIRRSVLPLASSAADLATHRRRDCR
jgi:3-deoxy-manno-octulosonate cytidylyltransferase (CMP-KDO synthetase)